MQLTDEEKRWLTGLAQFDEGNTLAILALFAAFKMPRTYFDIGCGTGAMVKAARALGVDAWGVDILPHEEPYLLQQDLRTFCDLGRKFDLVTSIETAEHIEPEYVDTFCDTLARHVGGDGKTTGGLLIFTAAAPGQLGDHHVSCFPKAFWREKLEKRELRYSQTATDLLYQMWHNTLWPTHWCEENLQVFATAKKA